RQGQMIVGFARRHDAGHTRRLLEAFEERAQRAVIEPRIAPIKAWERVEAMILDRLDDLGVERAELGRGAEGAIAHMPPGAAGNLRDLRRGEPARRAPV